jgi:hypothetical protein
LALRNSLYLLHGDSWCLLRIRSRLAFWRKTSSLDQPRVTFVHALVGMPWGLFRKEQTQLVLRDRCLA